MRRQHHDQTLQRARGTTCTRRSGRLQGLWLCTALVCVSARPSAAHAQEIGKRSNLVLAADRLFGLYLDNISVDTGPTNLHRDSTVIGVGWNRAASTLSVPRIGVDFLLTDAITLGGTLGIVSHNLDLANGNSGTTTGILLGARAGYMLRLGQVVSFWPRGGLTYTSVSGAGRNNSSHVLALSIEAPFTITPATGFAILVGPCLELGFVGREAANDYSEVMFGLMIGLAGFVGL